MKKIYLKHIKHQIDLKQEISRYVILIFVPMIFCIALYYGINKITLKQMQDKANVLVEMFVQMTNSIMHETEMVDQSLVSDFIYLNNSTSAEDLIYSYDKPESISRQIAIRMEASSYIEQIYYISYKMDRIYSAAGCFDMSSLESIINGYGISMEEIAETEDSTWNMIVTEFIRGPYNITPTRDSEGEINGYLITILDLDIFMNNIFGLDTEYACFYNDKTFISSFSVPKSFANSGQINESTLKKLLGDKVKYFFMEVDDYTYMVAIDAKEYYLPYRLMSYFFFLYALIVITFGIAWLFKISKERHEQLSSIIKELDPENPPDTYQSLIADIREKLIISRDGYWKLEREQKNVLFRDIIHNSYSKDNLKTNLVKLGIPIEDTKYYAARFYIKSYNNVALVSSHLEDTRQVIKTIFESAMSRFSEDNSFSIFYCMDQDGFSTLFYNDRNVDFDKSIMALCESINSFLQDEYGIDIHTAISKDFVDVFTIKDAFRSVDDLERYASAISNSSKIIFEAILKEHGDLLLTGDFFKQEQTLVNTLLLKKYDAIPAMVESIIKEQIINGKAGIKTAESRLQTLSGILSEAVWTIENEKIDKQNLSNRLQNAITADRLIEESGIIFKKISDSLASEPINYPKVDEACDYIKCNLSNTNLNVRMICDEVGIIVQRLTPMFQEKLGMGIAEYVNFKRIEQAKMILLTTKLTVKQVGEEVGYVNTDTFTRNFRKLENMTPTEYRKLASL